MSTLDALIEDAEALSDLLAEHLCNLRGLKEQGALVSVEAGIVATSMASAKTPHVYEREDLLPQGRLRHTPYKKQTADESRAEVVGILRSIGDAWVVPSFWAEQHKERMDARKYYKSLLAFHCRKLCEDGYVEERAYPGRGARCQFRLREAYRGDSPMPVLRGPAIAHVPAKRLALA